MSLQLRTTVNLFPSGVILIEIRTSFLWVVLACFAVFGWKALCYGRFGSYVVFWWLLGCVVLAEVVMWWLAAALFDGWRPFWLSEVRGGGGVKYCFTDVVVACVGSELLVWFFGSRDFSDA
ncbi:hypothetical protein TSUD_104500 [Trifolium subterraneum]|uniref:Uncharacterized protein n=1 Tax=Trifolium subterraneum TaxID=3900 RepID=A0A2Z6M4Q6_TRISU|nr:hypothetical protein TSUD_104500 [Trifolium subterraneum]